MRSQDYLTASRDFVEEARIERREREIKARVRAFFLKEARAYDGKVLIITLADEIAQDPDRVSTILNDTLDWLPDTAEGVLIINRHSETIRRAKPRVTGHRAELSAASEGG